MITGSWRDVMKGEGYASFSSASEVRLDLGARPALLVVDVVTAFLGNEQMSLDESIAAWPLSCGPAGWEALPRIEALIDAARSAGIFVLYTTGNPGILGGATKTLVDTRDDATVQAMEISASIVPRMRETVLAKARPSAFFGTPLAAILVQQRIDTLVVAGCTTSGCVRATVVDGHSYGWPVVVAEDAVFDRSSLSHEVSLFEMNAKYATVVPAQEIVTAATARKPRNP